MNKNNRFPRPDLLADLKQAGVKITVEWKDPPTLPAIVPTASQTISPTLEVPGKTFDLAVANCAADVSVTLHASMIEHEGQTWLCTAVSGDASRVYVTCVVRPDEYGGEIFRAPKGGDPDPYTGLVAQAHDGEWVITDQEAIWVKAKVAPEGACFCGAVPVFKDSVCCICGRPVCDRHRQFVYLPVDPKDALTKDGKRRKNPPQPKAARVCSRCFEAIVSEGGCRACTQHFAAHNLPCWTCSLPVDQRAIGDDDHVRMAHATAKAPWLSYIWHAFNERVRHEGMYVYAEGSPLPTSTTEETRAAAIGPDELARRLTRLGLPFDYDVTQGNVAALPAILQAPNVNVCTTCGCVSKGISTYGWAWGNGKSDCPYHAFAASPADRPADWDGLVALKLDERAQHTADPSQAKLPSATVESPDELAEPGEPELHTDPPAVGIAPLESLDMQVTEIPPEGRMTLLWLDDGTLVWHADVQALDSNELRQIYRHLCDIKAFLESHDMPVRQLARLGNTVYATLKAETPLQSVNVHARESHACVMLACKPDEDAAIIAALSGCPADTLPDGCDVPGLYLPGHVEQLVTRAYDAVCNGAADPWRPVLMRQIEQAIAADPVLGRCDKGAATWSVACQFIDNETTVYGRNLDAALTELTWAALPDPQVSWCVRCNLEARSTWVKSGTHTLCERCVQDLGISPVALEPELQPARDVQVVPAQPVAPEVEDTDALVDALVKIEKLRTAKSMGKIITALCKKHGVDLIQVGAHLRLEMTSWMPLVVEVTAPNHVAVAHYREENGDLIADPEIVFWTGQDKWIPLEVTQVAVSLGGHTLGGWKRYVEISEDGMWNVTNPRMQADLASFACTWARNIKAQGWLERGQPQTAYTAFRETVLQLCAKFGVDLLAAHGNGLKLKLQDRTIDIFYSEPEQHIVIRRWIGEGDGACFTFRVCESGEWSPVSFEGSTPDAVDIQPEWLEAERVLSPAEQGEVFAVPTCGLMGQTHNRAPLPDGMAARVRKEHTLTLSKVDGDDHLRYADDTLHLWGVHCTTGEWCWTALFVIDARHRDPLKLWQEDGHTEYVGGETAQAAIQALQEHLAAWGIHTQINLAEPELQSRNVLTRSPAVQVPSALFKQAALNIRTDLFACRTAGQPLASPDNKLWLAVDGDYPAARPACTQAGRSCISCESPCKDCVILEPTERVYMMRVVTPGEWKGKTVNRRLEVGESLAGLLLHGGNVSAPSWVLTSEEATWQPDASLDRLDSILQQEAAKRAAEVAIAGGHSILFVGAGNVYDAERLAAWVERHQTDARAVGRCPCGNLVEQCHCEQAHVDRWTRCEVKPLVEEADIVIEVRPVNPRDLRKGETDECVLERAMAALHRLSESDAQPDQYAVKLLKQAKAKLGFDKVVAERITQVAKTIAVLAGKDEINAAHMAEAIQYWPKPGAAPTSALCSDDQPDVPAPKSKTKLGVPHALLEKVQDTSSCGVMDTGKVRAVWRVQGEHWICNGAVYCGSRPEVEEAHLWRVVPRADWTGDIIQPERYHAAETGWAVSCQNTQWVLDESQQLTLTVDEASDAVVEMVAGKGTKKAKAPQASPAPAQTQPAAPATESQATDDDAQPAKPEVERIGVKLALMKLVNEGYSADMLAQKSKVRAVFLIAGRWWICTGGNLEDMARLYQVVPLEHWTGQVYTYSEKSAQQAKAIASGSDGQAECFYVGICFQWAKSSWVITGQSAHLVVDESSMLTVERADSQNVPIPSVPPAPACEIEHETVSAPASTAKPLAPSKPRLPEGVPEQVEVDMGRVAGWMTGTVIGADKRQLRCQINGKIIKLPLAGRGMVWRPNST